MAGIHDGHRARFRKRYLDNGLDGFQPHEILELLLYYSVPRADTNPLGHLLLDEFGSLSAVFEAPYEELLKIKGISENSATLIKLIPDICRSYFSDKSEKSEYLNTPDKIGDYLVSRFIGYKNEVMYAVFMDNRCKVLDSCIISQGMIGRVPIDIRKIVSNTLKYSATALVIAHNHPNNSALPSKEDIHETIKLVETLKPLGISLVDHIIVSGNDYISLAASRDYGKIFSR